MKQYWQNVDKTVEAELWIHGAHYTIFTAFMYEISLIQKLALKYAFNHRIYREIKKETMWEMLETAL